MAAVRPGPSWRQCRSRSGRRSSGSSEVFRRRPAFPPVIKTGQVEGEDFLIEKLAYESFPGYHMPALLYKPRKIVAPVPGVLSPLTRARGRGVPDVAYQSGEAGYVVLSFDPVGQGERSQFWDAKRPGLAST